MFWETIAWNLGNTKYVHTHDVFPQLLLHSFMLPALGFSWFTIIEDPTGLAEQLQHSTNRRSLRALSQIPRGRIPILVARCIARDTNADPYSIISRSLSYETQIWQDSYASSLTTLSAMIQRIGGP